MTKPSTPFRKSLKPITPNPQIHLRAMGQLAADAFSGGQYVDAFCNNYIGNSILSSADSALGRQGGLSFTLNYKSSPGLCHVF